MLHKLEAAVAASKLTSARQAMSGAHVKEAYNRLPGTTSDARFHR